MMETDDKPLMHFRPKNDFERLLWAREEIKTLKKELEEKENPFKKQLAEKDTTIEKLEDRIALLHELSPMNNNSVRSQNINLKIEKNKLKAKYDDLFYKYTIMQQNPNNANMKLK